MALGSPQWMYKSGEAYELDQSLKFEDGRSTYLTKTPTTTSNRKTWTFSTWLKLGNLGANRNIFGAGSNYDEYTVVFIRGDVLDPQHAGKRAQVKVNPADALDDAAISEIIEMALSDHTSFTQIRSLYGLREKEVKKLMRSRLKSGSYKVWRTRVRSFSDRRATYK